MTDHAAIDMLSKEHKIILQVVLGLHGLAGHLREGRRVDVELLREAVDFMREFADKCHHAKEEELLFPALVAHGVPLHGCPLDALLHEHKKGRLLAGQLSDAIDAYHAGERDGGDKITTAIEAIERLYPDHIWKEDDMVFPMSARLIPAKDRERLFVQFTEVEARNPPGTHERYHDFARRLALASSH